MSNNKCFPSDLDFETLLITITDRARVIKETISLVLGILEDTHEEFKRAESHDIPVARFVFESQVLRLLPVLEMLEDYAKNNEVDAKKTYAYYCGSTGEGSVTHEKPTS